tara:strand:+ start:124 stop:702 length:579 start_codon:yes stop_codon:yes gene_type:complete
MTQYAYPDADTSVGNWTASTGSNRYAMVDDAHGVAAGTADNTYIRVTDDGQGDDEMNPIAEAITLSLSSVTDPSASNLHKVKILWHEDTGQGALNLNVSLRDTDGGAVKDETFTFDAGGGFDPPDSQEDTMTLSASQANSIGAYSNLSVIITATDSMLQGTNTSVFRVYFECPDAAASGATATPAAFLLFLD